MDKQDDILSTLKNFSDNLIKEKEKWEKEKAEYEAKISSMQNELLEARNKISSLETGSANPKATNLAANSSRHSNAEEDRIQELEKALANALQGNYMMQLSIEANYPNEVKLYRFPIHLLQRRSLRFDELQEVIEYWISVHKYLGPAVAADLVKVLPNDDYWKPDYPRAKNTAAEHNGIIYLVFRSKTTAAYFTRIVSGSGETIVMFDQVYNFRPYAELIERQ